MGVADKRGNAMKPILILYATREGQTRRIAEHISARLQEHHVEAAILDAAHIPEEFSLGGYSAAIVSASVHGGKHEREIVQFVKFQRSELENMPTAFLSVSLSEAGAEDASASSVRRAQAAADARRMIDDFLKETRWSPERIKAIAGALAYTKYNFLMRLVMKQIARRAGGSTDTSRDREYTNWSDLDHFVDDFLGVIQEPAAAMEHV